MEPNEKQLEKAKEVYANLCKMLDEDEWKYNKDEEKMVIYFTTRGEDIPMDFVLYIDPSPGLIRLLSRLPFEINKEKMIDAAIAVCAINYRLINGSFVIDITDGDLLFRMNQAYIDSEIGPELFKYMVFSSIFMVDEYNDKFLMLNKGNLSINDFLTEING